jgi:4-hydroxy-L-threonine phosphate dehydrogenase PdxA
VKNETDASRWESGIASPRLGVCALNPHNGENGSFGRQEIDHIIPAVHAAVQKGVDVQDPFHFDGIVTIYHDQGQIAMKLLSFDGGVTAQGGLPIPMATPAHGTAFDIVGKNAAGITSTQNAFDIACTMAERRIAKKDSEATGKAEVYSLPGKALPQTTVVKVAACC